MAVMNRVNINHNTIARNGQDGITLPGNRPQWQWAPNSSNVIYDNGEQSYLFTYTATTEVLHDVIERNNLLYLPLTNR